jgi:hypothetical protein
MDHTLQTALAGFLLLILIIGLSVLILPPSGSHSGGIPPSQTVLPTVLSVTMTVLPTYTGLPSPTPALTVTTVPEIVQVRIDNVNTSDLALGRTSYAYITLTNTGTVPVTIERIEILIQRDFGFPLGNQSRSFVHELYDRIGPGETRTLRDEFDLPLYEGTISLEGLYEVSMTVYVNDSFYIGEWQGEVYLEN